MAVLASATCNCPIASSQVIFDGVIIDQPNRYDGYPVHLFSDGLHRIWFCAESPITDHDGVFYSQKTGGLDSIGGWSTPIELFNVNDIPWVQAVGGMLICDPTVLRGDFTYDSASYGYAMYFTADRDSSDPGNAVGAAFSNDGVNWIIHSVPIIEPDGGYDGSYGAGESGIAWGREPGVLHQPYTDTTAGFAFPRIRYKQSMDGLVFTPTPSLDTQLSVPFVAESGRIPR